MEEIRAFIAIELPDEVKSNLSEVLQRLKPGREKAVKWVNPDGIHLTLKFLGNIPSNKVVDITQAIESASEHAGPIKLNLQGLGAFPNLKSPRVAWVGIGGDIPNISNLQRQIDQSLIPLGFPSEKRAFSPHLTIGRVRDKATHRERSELGNAIGSMELNKASPFIVDRVSLIQSTLTRNGANYNQIATVMLDKK